MRKSFVLAMWSTLGVLCYGGSALAPVKEPWQVLPPIIHGNLAIYPVMPLQAGGSGATGYVTLDEGVKAGTVEVREAGSATPLVRNRQNNGGRVQNIAPPQGGGEVNRLVLLNHSGKKLILISGEMVVGGKQDRIIQRDGLIPPSKEEVSLEVFCVEHGRWSGADSKFVAPVNRGKLGAFADPTVRGAAQGGGGQSHVWKEVDAKNAKVNASPATQTYAATVMSKKAQEGTTGYEKALNTYFPKKGAIGVVVAVNGKLIWADVLLDSALFYRYWPKLRQSYLVEAVTEVGPKRESGYRHPTKDQAIEFLMVKSGKATFEGKPNVYKLTRTEGNGAVTNELEDIAERRSALVHFNKMLKK